MKRTLLIGVTVAGVAGVYGAAFAASTAPLDGAAPTTTGLPTETSTAGATTAPTSSTATTVPTHASRTVTYQVGDAGTVTLKVDAGVLTTRQIQPAAGWTVASVSGSGAHTEVHFASSSRLVTFVADLVGDDVVVSVLNKLVPGSTGPAPAPITVSIVPPATEPIAALQPAVTSSTSIPTSDDEHDDEDDGEFDDGEFDDGEFDDGEFEDEDDDRDEDDQHGDDHEGDNDNDDHDSDDDD